MIRRSGRGMCFQVAQYLNLGSNFAQQNIEQIQESQFLSIPKHQFPLHETERILLVDVDIRRGLG